MTTVLPTAPPVVWALNEQSSSHALGSKVATAAAAAQYGAKGHSASAMAGALNSRHRVPDPLPIVAEKINALLDRATNADEAEGACIIAARELAAVKARVDDGGAGNVTWAAWCSENIQRPQSDILKVLGLANVIDPAARLETWLKACRLAPAEFGRSLGLRWPYSVRRYLRTDANGRPRKDWRAPRRDIQLRIERATRGCVTRADWAREAARRAGATFSAAIGRQPITDAVEENEP